MIDSKPWYLSKGVWGSVISILVILAGTFNSKFKIDADDQSAVVNIILTVVGAIASGVGLYGRVVATAVITAKKE